MVVKPLLFLFNIAIGYTIMLVLMTYNFGLIMAILGGNFLGYLVFNIVIQEFLMERQQSKQRVLSSANGGDSGGAFISYHQQQYEEEEQHGRTSGHFFDDEYDDLDHVNPNGDPFEQ
jgi:hypothetical protein